MIDWDKELANAMRAQNYQLMIEALDNGANIETRDIYNRTSLMIAIGYKWDVQEFLDMGADVHAVDGIGNTTLMLAVRESSLEVVKLLIDRGVDVNALDRRSLNALHYAYDAEYEPVIELIEEACAKTIKQKQTLLEREELRRSQWGKNPDRWCLGGAR